MSIATYAELLTAIQNYQDDTSIIVSDRDDEWVTLCEQRIHYGYGNPGEQFYSPALRVRPMEHQFTLRIEAAQDGGTSGGSANAQTLTMTAPTVALGLTLAFTAGFTNTGATTLQPTGGSAVAIRKGVNNDALEANDIVLGAHYTVYYDGTYYKLMPGAGGAPLPTRFLGFKNIYDDATTNRPLSYISGQYLPGMAGANSSGEPIGYTIEEDCLRLVSISDGTRFIRGMYYKRFDALSTAVNELFRRAPGIYLYGSLLEASLYLEDDNGALKWHRAYSAACAGIARADKYDRQGAGPLVMRPGNVV
jgi:hypothetical protein